MSPQTERRGFLVSLAALPFVGGGVELIGQPTAAAVLVTPDLLEGYKTWLHYERRWLTWEMAEVPSIMHRYGLRLDQQRLDRADVVGGCIMHVGTCASWDRSRPPSTRAATVLATVGADWRERRRP